MRAETWGAKRPREDEARQHEEECDARVAPSEELRRAPPDAEPVDVEKEHRERREESKRRQPREIAGTAGEGVGHPFEYGLQDEWRPSLLPLDDRDRWRLRPVQEGDRSTSFAGVPILLSLAMVS